MRSFIGRWDFCHRMDDGSRMSREVHVRFCERLEVKSLRPTHPYVPIGRGFLYLVAIMDWASRAVLAWRLSNTMDVSFCLSALEEALARFGRPEIFNTDQSLPPRRRGAASSRALPSPARWLWRASRSPWTDAAGGWTTSSSSGCGGRSNTRTSISKATPTAAK